MITNRQIERLWTAKSLKKLYHELIAARPEVVFGLEAELSRQTAVAALAVIRLDELSQSYVPLYSKLVRSVLAAQEADGGWGDLATTALCIRALLCCGGDGLAIQRGLAYLAELQKPQGIWPTAPLRRMPEDPAVSLFILHQLGDQPAFRSAIHLNEALSWFDLHHSQLDRDLVPIWERMSLRCGSRARDTVSLFAA